MSEVFPRGYGQLKVTIQKFYRINGGTTQLRGVEPDVVLPDVYDGIEQGEKEMDFHLAYDKIPAAEYKPFNPYKEAQRKKAIEQSAKRLQKNPYYNLVQQRAKELAAVRTSYTYSLNMSKFEQQEAALRAQDKPLRDYKYRSICDTVMALDVDMQGVKGDCPMFLFRASSAAKEKYGREWPNDGRGRVFMRVLGIDPGLRNLGWGVIDVVGSRTQHVANGICHSARGEGEGDLALRLVSLYEQLTEVLRTYAPDAAAVEHTFVNKDAVATLKLGQARGIALLVPAQAGITVGEYAPNAVKKTVVGVGHAAKVQVDHMVRLHLPGVVIAGPDAADALAIAICHAHNSHGARRRIAAAMR